MAATNTCFSVSSTVNYVHSSLPFFTALGEEARRSNSSTVAVLLTSSGDLGSLFDLYFRSLSWGFLIILLFVIIILITSLHLITVYYCCFKRTEPDQHQLADNKHCCLKWGCGSVTIACGMCCVAILALGFWFESTLNRILLTHASPSSISNETIRHWMVLAVLIIAVLLVTLTIFAFIFLIFRQWGKCFNIMLVSLLLIIALVAPVSGVGLSILSYTSAFCEEFAVFPNCSSPITTAWSDICTTAFQDGFILMILGCGLVLFISLGQCSGAVFSHLFLSHSKRSTRVNSSVNGLNGSRDILAGGSTADRHAPTAPPQTRPPAAATFVGESQLQRADRYLTGDQTNEPRRRQTLPAQAEPPPMYDDAWLSQSVQVTGTTQELAPTTNLSSSDPTRLRTDNNPINENTSL